jgi:hypothetical protein
VTRAADQLLPLDEALRRLHPFARFHAGVRPVPLRRIVGSEGRAADFDRRFVPRRRESHSRIRELAQAFPDGNFPAITVQQLGEAYFVVDGHHRVALALRRGMEAVDADVTVVRARWSLGPDSRRDELLHAEQEWLFMQESGLAETRPQARIRFSEPVGYSQLLSGVEAHGYRIGLAAGAVVTRGEAASHWYDRVYLPGVAAIERERVEGICANPTLADRFLWLGELERELRLESRCVTFDDAVRRAVQERAARRPRLLRRG